MNGKSTTQQLELNAVGIMSERVHIEVIIPVKLIQLVQELSLLWSD